MEPAGIKHSQCQLLNNAVSTHNECHCAVLTLADSNYMMPNRNPRPTATARAIVVAALLHGVPLSMLYITSFCGGYFEMGGDRERRVKMF